MKISVFVILITILISCEVKYNPQVTVDDLRENIEYLASDSLHGRKPGKPGDFMAAEYIRSKFEDAGLELLYENGFQYFNLVASAELGEGNSLTVEEQLFTAETDFLPYAFSANTTVDADVVFAGYGLDVDKDTLKWNDFAGIDVSGKWIMVLQGDPDLDNATSPFLEFSSERAKGLTASDKNAAGLILVAGPKFNEKDELSSLFYDKNSSRFSIPVLQVTRVVANKILAKSQKTVADLENTMLDKHAGMNLESKSSVRVSVNVQLKETTTQNAGSRTNNYGGCAS